MSYFTPSGGNGAQSDIIVAPSGPIRSLFSSAFAVAVNGTADVLTYTVPIDTTIYLLQINIGGTNIATWDVLVNSAQFARRRTYFGSGVDGDLHLGTGVQDAPILTAGDVLIIRVTNFRPTIGDFESRLQYIEVS